MKNQRNKQITKSELIFRLDKHFPHLDAKDTEIAVKVILTAMIDALNRGQRIEIRGFGSFNLIRRPPRIGRNPRSGVKVSVPAKYAPHFKAGLDLKLRVAENTKPLTVLQIDDSFTPDYPKK